jgi:hypothetical protein
MSFAFSASDRGTWTQKVLGERNQNISVAQKDMPVYLTCTIWLDTSVKMVASPSTTSRLFEIVPGFLAATM